MRKTTGKIFIYAVLQMIAVTVLIVGTDVLAAPAWRGDTRTTFEQWSFTEQDSDPQPPDTDPHWVNEYGTPLLSVFGSEWNNTVDGHQGVWTFMGFGSGVLADIPNNDKALPEKEIWVELTWKAAGISNFIPDKPNVDVWANHKEVELIHENQIDGGAWWSSLYIIHIWPNPSAEQITINGDIYLDQVVIDTYCGIPEPGIMSLLGLGAVLGLRRKRHV